MVSYLLLLLLLSVKYLLYNLAAMKLASLLCIADLCRSADVFVSLR
jgi:hypothetical protein